MHCQENSHANNLDPGREQARFLIQLILKTCQPIAIWIPKDVWREFADNDPQEAKRIITLIEDVAQTASIPVLSCPIKDINLRNTLSKDYPRLDRGELDAIHQAKLIPNHPDYQNAIGKVLTGDSDLLNIQEFHHQVINWNVLYQRYKSRTGL